MSRKWEVGAWQCPTCDLWSRADRDRCYECLQLRPLYGQDGERLARGVLRASPLGGLESGADDELNSDATSDCGSGNEFLVQHQPCECGCERDEWFAEGIASQAKLGRVRILAAEWEQVASAASARNYAASLFGTAAKELREALDDK